MLQCVAVRCSVLQCVAVCCRGRGSSGDTVSYCVSCSVLQCVAVCCSLLQSVAVCCSLLQWEGKQWGYSVLLFVVQCVAVLCNMLQCIAVGGETVGLQCLIVCCQVCCSVCCNVPPSASGRGNSGSMEWLRFVVSLKSYISFAKYRLFYRALLQKSPIIERSLLIVATS